MYKKVTLKNKLRVVLLPLKEAKSVHVAVSIKAGSRFENKKNNGIAHFLEHMAFKGSKDFKNQFELAKYVEGMGGDWNASTGSEVIKYYISSQKDHLKDLVYVLDQMILHPLFNLEDIENEKGVIVEELHMRNDDPMDRVATVADELMWPEHPLGRNGLGTIETIKSFTKSDFQTYQKALFVPENMIIGVSGNFESQKVLKLIENTFGKINGKQTLGFDKVALSQKSPRIKIETRQTAQTHLELNFIGISRADKRRYSLSLAAMLLGGGISSRLFQKIRTELGLAYYISSQAVFYSDTGYFAISAGVKKSALKQALVEIRREIHKFLVDGISEEELRRNKNHLKGLLALQLENHASLNGFLTDQELLTGNILTYEGLMGEIAKISRDDILKVSREVFADDRLNLAIVGEANEKQVLEALEL